MPSPPALLSFAGATLLLLVIPGPSVMYIVTRSASQGRRAGLVSVAGIHTGTLVHILAAIVGLSALVVASATAFTAVKLAGAAYLIYLGVRTLAAHRHHGADTPLAAVAARTHRRIFSDAVVVNVLNPKTAVFFLAFVPQFVDRSAASAPQIAVLGGLFILLGLISDGTYALVGGWIGTRLTSSPVFARRRDLVAGTTFVGLGVATAAAGAPRS